MVRENALHTFLSIISNIMTRLILEAVTSAAFVLLEEMRGQISPDLVPSDLLLVNTALDMIASLATSSQKPELGRSWTILCEQTAEVQTAMNANT